jgi:hypothetical protein
MRGDMDSIDIVLATGVAAHANHLSDAVGILISHVERHLSIRSSWLDSGKAAC